MFTVYWVSALIIACAAFELEELWILQFTAIPAALALPVILMWVFHPKGVRDWTQGGVVYTRLTPSRLYWYDWAIYMTRKGVLDAKGREFQLQRRCCYGLIPLGTLRHSLDEFSHVDVVKDEVHGEDSLNRIDMTVYLVGKKHHRLNLLDLAVGSYNSPGEAFIDELGEALEMALKGDAGASKAS